ncbi:ethionine resistance protein [Coemansia spiralis]|nr:ethionine resistance protein [Coemansia spiralis]
MLAGIVIYSWRSEARLAWGGWTRRALVAMPQYYRLAIPSMILVCSDWAAWELMALGASYLGNVPLAAQSIVINTCALTYQVTAGLSIAISSRAGNLLGQARARRARVTSSAGLLLGVVNGILNLVFYVTVASRWGIVYTNDPEVIAMVALIMPFCGVFQVIDSVNGAGGGVVRSIGRQAAGAWISVPSYYIVGIPLGVYLTYGRPAMGIAGLWIGISTSAALTVFGQIVIFVKANYAKEIERCMARVDKTHDVAGTVPY